MNPNHCIVDNLIHIESAEVCAIKDSMPVDGPCVFADKSAMNFGEKEYLDDKKGHVLMQNQPLAVCDKTAVALSSLEMEDILITESSYFYDGGGCC